MQNNNGGSDAGLVSGNSSPATSPGGLPTPGGSSSSGGSNSGSRGRRRAHLVVVDQATNGLAAVEERSRVGVLLDLLIGSVEELGEAGQDHRYGFGRIDVLRAIGLAKEQGL